MQLQEGRGKKKKITKNEGNNSGKSVAVGGGEKKKINSSFFLHFVKQSFWEGDEQLHTRLDFILSQEPFNQDHVPFLGWSEWIYVCQCVSVCVCV